MKGYSRWFPLLLHLLLLSVMLSGVLLLPSMLAFRFEQELSWVPSGDQRQLIAMLHTLISFLTLSALGALLAIHVRVGWRHGGNRLSGFATLVALLGLMLSSLGIFYFGDDDLARQACLLHVALAGILLPAFLWHWLHGRRLARERHWQHGR